MCEHWGEEHHRQRYGYSQVGAVVGATYPSRQLSRKMRRLRTPSSWCRATARRAAARRMWPARFDKNGLGAIVNSSRAILTALAKEGCDRVRTLRRRRAARPMEATSVRRDDNLHVGVQQNIECERSAQEAWRLIADTQNAKRHGFCWQDGTVYEGLCAWAQRGTSDWRSGLYHRRWPVTRRR